MIATFLRKPADGEDGRMGKTMGKPWEKWKNGKDGDMEGNTKPKWDETHEKTMGKHQVNPEKT